MGQHSNISSDWILWALWSYAGHTITPLWSIVTFCVNRRSNQWWISHHYSTSYCPSQQRHNRHARVSVGDRIRIEFYILWFYDSIIPMLNVRRGKDKDYTVRGTILGWWHQEIWDHFLADWLIQPPVSSPHSDTRRKQIIVGKFKIPFHSTFYACHTMTEEENMFGGVEMNEMSKCFNEYKWLLVWHCGCWCNKDKAHVDDQPSWWDALIYSPHFRLGTWVLVGIF